MRDYTTKIESKTDIVTDSWVMFLPPKVRPYALLMRLDRPIGIHLLFAPVLWSTALAFEGEFPFSKVAIFFIGAILVRAAGCIVNDIWDRDIDPHVARTKTRPLAIKSISMKSAIMLCLGLALVALFILLSLGEVAIYIGLLVVPLIIIYPLMKRVTFWPQLFLGVTFNTGVLIAWASLRGELAVTPFLLYVSGLFWTVAYDTIYAYQDLEDDLQVGVKSTAIYFGKKGKVFLGGCFAGFSLFSLIAGMQFGLSYLFYIGWGFVVAMVLWQLSAFSPSSSTKNLFLFRFNRFVGYGMFCAYLWGRL